MEGYSTWRQQLFILIIILIGHEVTGDRNSSGRSGGNGITFSSSNSGENNVGD